MRSLSLLSLLLLAACSASEPADDARGGADAGAGDDESGLDAGGAADEGAAFSEVHLATTHNSYSGSIGGDRGTLREQLDLGVRVLEFDIHDNDFENEGYRLGHDAPGDEVDHGGSNPDSDRLEDWLAVVAEFSEANPQHAPIVLNLDAKDDLTDNADQARGEMGMLAAVVQDAFGDSLIRAEDIADDDWPGVETLRGKVAVVVSGSHATRLRYRRADGRRPAVAVNASGQVVLVHDDDSGVLWAWTGVVSGEGVRWQQRARYDTGTDPAILLSEEGVVVEVHEDPNDDKLWYRVGELSPSGELSWSQEAGRSFPNDDQGVDPSLAFVEGEGLALREIHHSQSSGNPFYWNGVVDVQSGTVTWTRDGDDGSSAEPRFDESHASAGSTELQASVGVIGVYDASSLRVSVDGAEPSPVRYPQILFVDGQPGSSAQLRNDPGVRFFAADARDSSARAFAGDKRGAGGIVRLFGFENPDDSSSPTENHGATDHPFDEWYRDYCADKGCMDW